MSQSLDVAEPVSEPHSDSLTLLHCRVNLQDHVQVTRTQEFPA